MSTTELGALINARRIELRITQQHLADLGGISTRQLIDWESGKGNPGFRQLSSVLGVLGLQLGLQKAKTA